MTTSDAQAQVLQIVLVEFDAKVGRPLQMLKVLLEKEHWQAAADVMPVIMDGVGEFVKMLVPDKQPVEEAPPPAPAAEQIAGVPEPAAPEAPQPAPAPEVL